MVAHVWLPDDVPPLLAALDRLLQDLNVDSLELLLKVFVFVKRISVVDRHYNLLLLLEICV